MSDCTEALKRDPKCLINVHYALGPNRSHLRGGDGRRRPQRKPQEIGNAANHCMPPTIPMPSMYVRAEESVRCRGPSTSMQTDDVRFRTLPTMPAQYSVLYSIPNGHDLLEYHVDLTTHGTRAYVAMRSESAPHHLKANAPTSRNRIAIPRTDLSQWHAYVINALILAQADVIPATYQLPPSYH